MRLRAAAGKAQNLTATTPVSKKATQGPAQRQERGPRTACPRRGAKDSGASSLDCPAVRAIFPEPGVLSGQGLLCGATPAGERRWLALVNLVYELLSLLPFPSAPHILSHSFPHDARTHTHPEAHLARTPQTLNTSVPFNSYT